MDEATQFEYMPATSYMRFFVTDENYVAFDHAFAQKYSETQNVQETWSWFHDHFNQHMKTALEGYSKDMMERDAAKVVLAEQGIEFKDSGRTMVLDSDRMSEDPEDVEKVREALDRLYKE